MNLSDSPGRPASPSRASGWSSLTTPWGLPCCVRFPCVHAVATTPAQRLGALLRSFTQPYQPSPIWQSGRPVHRPFRGLLGVHSRYGLHTRVVTNSLRAIRRLQPLRYLHSCSGCFRLERLPGGTCTHWKAPPFHGARQVRTNLLSAGHAIHDRSFADQSRVRRASDLRPSFSPARGSDGGRCDGFGGAPHPGISHSIVARDDTNSLRGLSREVGRPRSRSSLPEGSGSGDLPSGDAVTS